MSSVVTEEIVLGVGLILAVYVCSWTLAAGLVRSIPQVAGALKVDGTRRQLCLDGLRGVLALSVVCHHWIVTRNFLATGLWETPQTRFATELGQASVALFLMITSFVFWGRLLDKGPRLRWDDFYVARILRLAPLYFTAVVIMVAIVLVETHGRLAESKLTFAGQLTDWFFFTVRRSPDLNGFPRTWQIVAGVTWSLRYEWALYLALPLLGCIFTGVRHKGWILSSLLMLGFFFRAAREQPLLLEIGSAFLGGIVAAYWIRSEKLRSLGEHPLFGGLALVCAAGVFWLCRTAYATVPLVLLTIVFTAVACDNRVFGWMSTAAARWLGEVSYGIYLLHGVFIWIATRWIIPGQIDLAHLGAWQTTLLAAATVLPLILITSLLNFYIERPGIALGRRFADQGKASPSETPARLGTFINRRRPLT